MITYEELCQIVSDKEDKEKKQHQRLISLINNYVSVISHSLGMPAEKIDAADGVLIGTPEYDHSIPAVLMNALAWLSYGIYPLLNKPVMITGASYGTLGSSRAQLQLRQILNAPEIKANVLPDEFLLSHSLQAFDPSGDLVDLDVVKKLDAIFDDFRIFVKITDKLRNAQELLRKDAEEFDWEKL